MNHRLPDSVVPTFEAVHLRLDPDRPDYGGSVHIELDVREATQSFSLHAERLEVDGVRLTGPGGKVDSVHQRTDPATIAIGAAELLSPGTYTLEIDFSNSFGTRAVGLYRAQEQGRWYVFSQFEADDAREAFPCWDEPAFKIPWQLTLVIPEQQMAVSNTPVDEQRLEDGWRSLTFARTRPLPSYLIAIAAGPFDAVPITGMTVPGRVITPHGQASLATTAAQMTPPILAALESYFASPYPYEKLDLIAIPEFWPGAMEHPGAVTYEASVLLAEPEAMSVAQKRGLARITAHELAHQWFGNLVTMEWWDDLWLNESFADWMGDKIAHQVHPEYKLDVTELQHSLQVMAIDARPSSQAIRQPVTRTGDLLQNIGLQYNKGKAVLAMFERWIGSERFQAGVLAYLDAHRWGNARADDLWESLSAAAGVDVAAAMTTFIDQPGLPLISVEVLPEPITSGDTTRRRVRLSQRRFATAGIEMPSLHWTVPVSLRYSDGAREVTRTVVLRAGSETIEIEVAGELAWLHPNADQRGYYHWWLPASMLEALAARASAVLTERERVGFIENLHALLTAGAVHGDEYMRILEALGADPEPMVVSTLLESLRRIRATFIDSESTEVFAIWVRQLLAASLDRIGAEPDGDEEEAAALVRPRLLATLAEFGRDREVIARSQRLAQRYLNDATAVDPSLAGAILEIAALDGDRTLFETYRQRLEEARAPADRQRYLRAMSGFRDPAVVDQVLRYVVDGPLRPDELVQVPRAMLEEPLLQDVVFDWFTANYAVIADRLPPVMLSLLPRLASGCSEDRLERARVFFSQPPHRVGGTDTQLAKVADQVGDCVRLREREASRVRAYLHELAAVR